MLLLEFSYGFTVICTSCSYVYIFFKMKEGVPMNKQGFQNPLSIMEHPEINHFKVFTNFESSAKNN